MRYREMVAERAGSILLETTRARPGRPSHSYCFVDPVEWLEVHSLDQLPGLFSRLAAAQAAGLWAAGYVGYECGCHWEPTAGRGFAPAPGGLPLAAFGLYREPVEFVSAGQAVGAGRGLDAFRFQIAPEEFARKVNDIHRWIEAGDTYQANLTDCVQGELGGSPAELFTHMMAAQPVEFGAMLHLPGGAQSRFILSASPELFFSLRDGQITVRPMKGTSPRGRDSVEDSVLAQMLVNDPKNRAENIMIVDLLRSDLGRIAEMGTVRIEKLFDVEQFPSLLQMSSEITARLRPEVDLYGVFGSLFPAGSIVGAPKVRTMQLLRTLEGRERGVYTGAIGCIAPSGDATFSVAIRTAVLEGAELSMGVGAGITYSSSAQAEYAECLLKAEFLREAPFVLIETMRWERGGCALLALHLERIVASAAYFGFACALEEVRAAVYAAGAGLSHEHAWKLRMTLDAMGRVAFDEPEPIAHDPANLRAMLWPEPVCSGDRFLRHKTTLRALYDAAVRAAQEQGYIDAVFVNEYGIVTEGAIHNVFVRHGKHWRTPPLDAGVLPGVYRAHLLASIPGISEACFGLDELLSADEVWLTNAVRGIRRIVLATQASPARIEPATHAMVRS